MSAVPPHTYCQITTLQGHTHYLQHNLVLLADFGLSCLEDEDVAVYNKKNAMRGAFDPSHDLVNFVGYLQRLQISDRAETKNVAALKQLKSLKRTMGTSDCIPAQLLEHEFFHCLRTEPPAGRVPYCIVCCFSILFLKSNTSRRKPMLEVMLGCSASKTQKGQEKDSHECQETTAGAAVFKSNSRKAKRHARIGRHLHTSSPRTYCARALYKDSL